jgi:ketosteroid isomerase-like protein
VLVPLLLAACTPAIGADPSTEIRQATAAFDSAWARQDTAAVARFMSQAYAYYSSRGDVIPRTQFLAFLADPEYTLSASERSEITPLFDGNTAVVGTRWRGHGTWKEGSFADDQRCSMVWHRAFDGWRLMSEHCTQIVPADSTG